MSGKVCPRCGGTGKLADHSKKGLAMQKLRIKAGLTLKEVGQRFKPKPLSTGYISDLEHGRRSWNPTLEASFLSAIGKGGE